MSAESGIPTFRGEGGLWEGFRPEEVATVEAWERDPTLVLRFFTRPGTLIYVVNPDAAASLRTTAPEIRYFPESAATALPRIVAELMKND